MSSKIRTLSYSLALNEAIQQMMEIDQDVFLMGQGVKSPWYVGNTTKGLLEKFGPARVIDTPVSENAVTGAGVGAAIAGMRPIIVHPRLDFMVYALDPIINEAANWHYMFGGQSSAPMVIWGIINRGGYQGAQHSQAFHALFSHIPGLKVVMPSTPYDAKGLMIAAIQDNNPVMFIDDRWLYSQEEDVPETMYSIPLGKGIIRKPGTQVTVVSISYMAKESLKAALEAENEGISVEVIDLRTAKPIDKDIIFQSVTKTGHLVIADGGWKTCGFAAEISALVNEELFSYLHNPVVRVTLPDIPAPAAGSLEDVYYPTSHHVLQAIKKVYKPQTEKRSSYVFQS